MFRTGYIDVSRFWRAVKISFDEYSVSQLILYEAVLDDGEFVLAVDDEPNELLRLLIASKNK